MLVGAMNPCPCGHFGDRLRACRCPPGIVDRYQQRLSGPLRDRFDLHVDMQAVPYDDLRATSPQESTAAVRARVSEARRRQLTRQTVLNGRLEGRALRTACAIEDDDADALLAKGATQLGLSARAVTRVLRVARTIADLSGAEAIRRVHLAEALQFRGPALRPPT
jgi:magnesium chelatase family protein